MDLTAAKGEFEQIFVLTIFAQEKGRVRLGVGDVGQLHIQVHLPVVLHRFFDVPDGQKPVNVEESFRFVDKRQSRVWRGYGDAPVRSTGEAALG